MTVDGIFTCIGNGSGYGSLGKHRQLSFERSDASVFVNVVVACCKKAPSPFQKPGRSYCACWKMKPATISYIALMLINAIYKNGYINLEVTIRVRINY